MLPLFAIPIVTETSSISSHLFDSAFFARPIDLILFDSLLYFGWIPIAITLTWGFIQMWVNYKQGHYSASLKHMLLAVDVPSQTEQTPKALENLFASLYGCKSSLTWKEKWMEGRFHPSFSFEIVSSEGFIQFFIRTQRRFRDIIEAGIYAHYPDAEISEVEDYTKKFPRTFPDQEYDMWGAEMTLDGPEYLPIKTYVDFEDSMTQEIKDPLGFTLEQMAKMRPGEHFWIQYLIQPSSNDWVKKGVQRINEIYGVPEKKKKSFVEQTLTSVLDLPSGLLKEASNFDLLGALFGASGSPEDDPFKAFKLSIRDIEEAKAIFKKTSKVGLGTKIRILYVAKKSVYAKGERTSIIKGILNQFSNLNFNKFTLWGPQVPKDDYFWMRWSYTARQRTLMTAYCNRSFGIGAHPKFFNTEELASLWHFPTISIKAPLIKKAESRRAEPPVGLPFTFEENILPGYGKEPEGAPQISFAPQSTDDLLHPPGLPNSHRSAPEPTTETVPRPVAPTAIPVPQEHVDDAMKTEFSEAKQEDLMPPQDLLPSIKSPTQAEESAEIHQYQLEDDDRVPPNLPT